MSEQEKKSGIGPGTSLVVVDQSVSSRHIKPVPIIDMQEEGTPDLHHNRSKAPVLPAAEEISNPNDENKKITDAEKETSSEQHKYSDYNVVKKRSSTKTKRDSSLETITLVPVSVESKPIPVPPKDSKAETDENVIEKKEDDDSIKLETAEVRTPEVAKASSEWSDDEEAGGLPRTESGGFRVFGAIRQLLCCGVQLESPSEHKISPRTSHDGI